MSAVTISSIQVKLAKNESTIVKAYVSFVVCDFLMVRDVRIVDLGRGPIIAMPSRRREETCPAPGCGGKVLWRQANCHRCKCDLAIFWDHVYEVSQVHYDVVHPINQDSRQLMTRAVMEAYEEALQKGDGIHGHNTSAV